MAALEDIAGRCCRFWNGANSLLIPIGEDGALLRDYVEVRVLDYLAADQARPEVLRKGSGLALADNAPAAVREVVTFGRSIGNACV